MDWSYSYDPRVWPALITIVSAVVLGWYSWQHRNVTAAVPFAIGCGFAALWAMGAAFEISADSVADKLFWFKFQVVWQPLTATAFPCFILVYAGLGRWLTRRNLVLLILLSLVAIGFIVTNDFHHLFWTTITYNGQYFVPVPGPVNRIFVIYGYILGLVSMAVLFWLAFRSPEKRKPITVMLLGQLFGRGIILIDYIKSGLLGPGEFILFSLGVISITYGLALFRFHVIDPVPEARATALEQMDDGMIVFDINKRVIDVNRAAVKISGQNESRVRGKTIDEILPLDTDILNKLRDKPPIQCEINLAVHNHTSYYYLEFTELTDKKGNTTGYLLLLHDVTEQKLAQARIMEQQSVVATLQERERLARELHDGIGQVLGYVSMQAQAVRDFFRNSQVDKAELLLERLINVSKDAHADVRDSILSLRTGHSDNWSFFSALDNYLESYRSNYGIDTELVLQDGLDQNKFHADVGIQLLRIIQESLSNARKHGSASTVSVSLMQNDHTATITITDNGSGFDTNGFTGNRENHFGLSFMQERIEQISGHLNISSKPGEGTIVILEVPLQK